MATEYIKGLGGRPKTLKNRCLHQSKNAAFRHHRQLDSMTLTMEDFWLIVIVWSTKDKTEILITKNVVRSGCEGTQGRKEAVFD